MRTINAIERRIAVIATIHVIYISRSINRFSFLMSIHNKVTFWAQKKGKYLLIVTIVA